MLNTIYKGFDRTSSPNPLDPPRDSNVLEILFPGLCIKFSGYSYGTCTTTCISYSYESQKISLNFSEIADSCSSNGKLMSNCSERILSERHLELFPSYMNSRMSRNLCFTG